MEVILMTHRLGFLVASTAGVAVAAGIAALLTGSAPATAAGALKPLQALIVNTDASPVPVEVIGGAASSHLGVPVEDHVMLILQTSAQTPCSEDGDEPGRDFHRVHPDGTIEAGPFVVPSGRNLVVTDVEAVLMAGSGNTFALGSVLLATVVPPARFDSSSTAPARTNGVTIAAATTGAVAVDASFSAGVVFSAGEQVCIEGFAKSANGGKTSVQNIEASVRGYLL
jgi:hypothetical protein